MTTPALFNMIIENFGSDVFGSPTLFAIGIVLLIVVLVLMARISFRIAFIIVFPAILALLGVGVSNGLLGSSYSWIGVLVLVGLGVGGLAFIWYRLSE